MRAALGAKAAAAAERLGGLAAGAELDGAPPLPDDPPAIVAELAALHGTRQFAQNLQVRGTPRTRVQPSSWGNVQS